MPLSKSERENRRRKRKVKPKFGHLYTPGRGDRQAGVRKKHFEWPWDLLPREGRGTFLHATDVDSDSMPVYRIVRNGLPVYYDAEADLYRETKPYVYGAPRARWARNSLDLAAIRAADYELERRINRTKLTRDQHEGLMECLGLGLSAQDISELTGIGLTTVYKYLRRAAAGDL